MTIIPAIKMTLSFKCFPQLYQLTIYQFSQSPTLLHGNAWSLKDMQYSAVCSPAGFGGEETVTIPTTLKFNNLNALIKTPFNLNVLDAGSKVSGAIQAHKIIVSYASNASMYWQCT